MLAKSGSSGAGCTTAAVSVARVVIVCSPGLGFQSNIQVCHVNGALLSSRFAFCQGQLSIFTSTVEIGCGRAVGTHPLLRCCVSARATPSRWRSSMASRSACPTAPVTLSINLPVLVAVSSGWFRGLRYERDRPRHRRSHGQGLVPIGLRPSQPSGTVPRQPMRCVSPPLRSHPRA